MNRDLIDACVHNDRRPELALVDARSRQKLR
jgi:hypothetical protein